MIHKYSKLTGVPVNAFYIYRIISFGDQGGARYEDKILVWSFNKAELEKYYADSGYTNPREDCSWQEYEISQHTIILNGT